MDKLKLIIGVLIIDAICLAALGAWGLLTEPGRHLFGEMTNFVCIAMLIGAAILFIAAGMVAARARSR
ncbi:MAG TPA: hypothetical protein VHV55_24400 [Pirellulales bacterium]|jgi:hypothetical protein|nr:hypothetical protein [Pirellulales bacterium]